MTQISKNKASAKDKLRLYLLCILAGLCMSVAWHFPMTGLAALLGWVTVFIICLGTRIPAGYLPWYLCGAITNAGGFFWLQNTVKDFGGFPEIAATGVFVLFVLSFALQFILFIFIRKNLPRFFNSLGIASASAWVAAEILPLRIFPWYTGHTQSGFHEMAQLADIGGVPLISFVMFFLMEHLIRSFRGKHKLRSGAIFICCAALSIIYGHIRLEQFNTTREDSKLKSQALMIQANIETEEKRNIKFFKKNTRTYISNTLSHLQKKPETPYLIIWPESVFQEFYPTILEDSRQDSRLPWFGPENSLISGALSYDPPEDALEKVSRIYNSAIAIKNDHSIPAMYHKRILMPFGEYMPLGETFPFLRKLNPVLSDFTAGTGPVVFPLKLKGQSLSVSPLICYEDIIESMARESVNEGADIIVSLSNDAWFGHTIAPFQHHQIALFRAIENRRLFLRSTNSGLTAAISATGHTTHMLPTFSQGILEVPITIHNNKTIFSRIGGHLIWQLLLIFCACLIVVKKCINKNS